MAKDKNIEVKINPLEAYADGKYVEVDTVTIRYVGRKGAVLLQKLTSKIFKGLQKIGSSSDSKDTDGKVTKEDIKMIIDVSGVGGEVMEEIIDSLKIYGTIRGENTDSLRITDTMLDEMEVEDVTKLYEEVVSNFLSVGVTRTLNKATNK